MASYSDREPSQDEFSQLSKSIAADIQKSGQLIRYLQSAASNENESAASIMKRYKEAESIVKSTAERMKLLRNTAPPLGKQERAKMERQRLQDSLLEVLTQLKDVDKLISVELKKRNETERKRLNSLQNNRSSDLLDINGSPSPNDTSANNPFFGGAGDEAANFNQHSGAIDPLHQVQMQQQQVEYEETLQAIQERDTAMRELEEGVLQVNEIFKDMAQLVHDQGDLIDNIETSVDKAESSARLANQNLGSAAKYQKRGNRTKFIFFSILLAIALFIALILVIKFS